MSTGTTIVQCLVVYSDGLLISTELSKLFFVTVECDYAVIMPYVHVGP